jgi:hypothetical protein
MIPSRRSAESGTSRKIQFRRADGRRSPPRWSPHGRHGATGGTGATGAQEALCPGQGAFRRPDVRRPPGLFDIDATDGNWMREDSFL